MIPLHSCLLAAVLRSLGQLCKGITRLEKVYKRGRKLASQNIKVGRSFKLLHDTITPTDESFLYQPLIYFDYFHSQIFEENEENAVGADLYLFTKWTGTVSSRVVQYIEQLSGAGVALWSVEHGPYNVTDSLTASGYFKPVVLYTRDSPLSEYAAVIDPNEHQTPSLEEDGLLQVC